MMTIALTLSVIAVLLLGVLTGFGFRLRFKPTRSSIYSQITALTALFTVLMVPFIAVYAALRRSKGGAHAT